VSGHNPTQARKQETMSQWKNFKEFAARELVAETQKVLPGLGRRELWQAGLIGSAIGWLLMSFAESGSGTQIYGVGLFVAALLTSIVTFESDL
jgi:hypothetical protein